MLVSGLGKTPGSTTFLQAYEDVTPLPGGGGSVPGPTPAPPRPVTPPPGLKPIVPKDLISLRPIDPQKPLVVLTCPPGTTDCAMRVFAYAAFGAAPVVASARADGAASRTARKAVLLGTASVRLAAGKTAKVRLQFTAAGRKAAKSKRSQKIRLLSA